jgi:hypothetical protein
MSAMLIKIVPAVSRSLLVFFAKLLTLRQAAFFGELTSAIIVPAAAPVTAATITDVAFVDICIFSTSFL